MSWSARSRETGASISATPLDLAAPEILRQVSSGLDAVFVPCGGGGLLAGVAAYFIVVGDESEGHPTSRLDLGPGGLTWTASF